MRASFAVVSLLALASLVACSGAESARPPSRDEIFAQLTREPSLALPRDPADGCDIRGVYTLTQYTAWLLRNLREEPARRQGVDVACSPLANGAYDCLVMAHLDDGEPWAYGVHFVLRRDRTIDPASLTCPGTP